MSTVKLTVTVPKKDFMKIEQEKKHQGLTRSALFKKMIETFFQAQSEKKKIKEYITGYTKKPEDSGETAARTSAQLQSLGEF